MMTIKSTFLLQAIFFIAFGTPCFGQNKGLYGIWKVTKCISDDPSNPQLSEDEKTREIGRLLVFTPERITIAFKNFSDSCNNPALTQEDIIPGIYFKDNMKESNWLGLSTIPQVKLWKTTCDGYLFKQFYQPKPSLIIMRAEGFYYYLECKNWFTADFLKTSTFHRDINFQGNSTDFENNESALAMLGEIAQYLKKRKSNIAIITGNTDNTITDLQSPTTVNGKDGTFKDLLLARADLVAKILIDKFGASKDQVVSKLGRTGLKHSTSIDILEN